MMKKAFAIALIALVVLGISLATMPENARSQGEVELIMHFWYIKFDDPSSDAWEITWSSCPEYRSQRDGNTVMIKTPYNTFKAVFDKGMGMYICGSAAHLFGLPFGQLPTLIPVEADETVWP